MLHTVLERQTLWFSSYKHRKLIVKLLELPHNKRAFFCTVYFIRRKFCFISMYSILNTISKYTYQKTILHILLQLVFKIVKSFQCILKCKKHESNNLPTFLWLGDYVTLQVVNQVELIYPNPANLCWSWDVFKTCLEDVFNTSSA